VRNSRLSHGFQTSLNQWLGLKQTYVRKSGATLDEMSMENRASCPTRTDPESEARDLVFRLQGDTGTRLNALMERVAAEGWVAVLSPLTLPR